MLSSFVILGQDLTSTIIRQSTLSPTVPLIEREKVLNFDKSLLNWLCQDILSSLSRKDHSCLNFGLIEALSTSTSLRNAQNLRNFLTNSTSNPLIVSLDPDGKKILDLIGHIASKQIKGAIAFSLVEREPADYSSEFPKILLSSATNAPRLLGIVKNDDESLKDMKPTETLLSYPLFNT